MKNQVKGQNEIRTAQAQKFFAIVGILTFIACASFASEVPSQKLSASEQDYLTVKSIQVTSIPNEMPVVTPCFILMKDCPSSVPTATPQAPTPIGSIGSVISIGTQIWKIVEAGKPSAHIVSNSVSALPKENPNWSQMTGWQGPLIKAYHMEAVNKMGIKVVSMDYKIMAYYGGKFQGKGQYLANLTMVTDNVSVAWGYDLQATAELMDLVNTTDEENPVPGCTLQMKWRTDTVLQHREGTHAVFVKGDGSVKDLQ